MPALGLILPIAPVPSIRLLHSPVMLLPVSAKAADVPEHGEKHTMFHSRHKCRDAIRLLASQLMHRSLQRALKNSCSILAEAMTVTQSKGRSPHGLSNVSSDAFL